MVTLSELRKQWHLGLEAAPPHAGLDPATIFRIERGLVEPHKETAVRLAQALHVSVARMTAT